MEVTPDPAVAASAGIGAVLSLLMILGAIVGWVLLVIAAWRAMKAHESIADSLSIMAERGR